MAIRVRRALLFYALKRRGLDVADDVRPPNAQHIVLLNRDEVDAALVRQAENGNGVPIVRVRLDGVATEVAA